MKFLSLSVFDMIEIEFKFIVFVVIIGFNKGFLNIYNIFVVIGILIVLYLNV